MEGRNRSTRDYYTLHTVVAKVAAVRGPFAFSMRSASNAHYTEWNESINPTVHVSMMIHAAKLGIRAITIVLRLCAAVSGGSTSKGLAKAQQ